MPLEDLGSLLDDGDSRGHLGTQSREISIMVPVEFQDGTGPDGFICGSKVGQVDGGISSWGYR